MAADRDFACERPRARSRARRSALESGVADNAGDRLAVGVGEHLVEAIRIAPLVSVAQRPPMKARK